MRNKSLTLSTVNYSLLTVICSVFLILSCSNPIAPPKYLQSANGGEQGYLALSLNGTTAGKTILPVTVDGDFTGYALVFSRNGINEIIVERNSANFSDPIALPVGTWKLDVTAYMDNELEKPAATGMLPAIVITPGNNTETVILKEIIDEGKGIFAWNIDYPDDIVSAYIKITPLDRNSGDLLEGEAQTLYFVGGAGSATVGKNDSLELDTGYYLVKLFLSNGERSTGLEEYLHVYKNLESILTEVFTQNYFTVQSVTNGADSGPGSLRHAIDNAVAGSTIVIENPLETISLASRLVINKSLTIEGNSAIVTRGAGWTVINDDSQLLYIEGSGTTVMINRVHFKNGRATDFGAGIRKAAGTALTLETCIFSGNRTTGSEAYGSAIFNSGSLNIIGCTFYDNSSAPADRGFGGAIYNSSGTLTLTGNVFIRNTANSSPVIRVGSSTVISNGYNLVDVDIGPGPAQSGWNAVTGDFMLSSSVTRFPLNISTFAPGFDGLQEIMPDFALEGFPAIDFYGTARTWPGAPGAVNYNFLPLFVSSDNGESIGYYNLADALDSITTAGDYTITFNAILPNQTLGPRTISTGGVKITLEGGVGEQEIQLATNGSLFTVGASGQAGIELTLGNNITLIGRTNGVNGVSGNNTNSVVTVQFGAGLTMLDGSKITGNTSSESVSNFGAAVFVNSGSTFTMKGGQLTGNASNYSTSPNNGLGAGGIFGASGSFVNLEGGSISGNTGPGGDAYFGAGNPQLTISGNAEIGVLTLSAISASNKTIPMVAPGWTGRVYTLNLRGNSSNHATAFGYWEDTVILQAASGYALTAADIARFTLGTFFSTVNTQPMTRFGIVRSGVDVGKLISLPAVSVSRNGGDDIAYDNLTLALNSITTAGNYTVIISEDQDLAPRTINTSGVNITLVSITTERKINLSSNGRLFTVGASGQSNISLTLGDNITLVGRSVGGNGNVNNTTSLVFVQYASFTMLDGSKITGNRSTGTAYGTSPAVSTTTNGIFIMKGGQITGNAAADTTSNSIASGLNVEGTGSYASIEGGSITGNTGGYGDVSCFQNIESFTLSGTAQIGRLFLNAGSATVYTTLTIAGNWTGNVAELNLRGNSSVMATNMGYWEYKPILLAASGYSLQAADIAKITLGNYINNSDGANTQAISGTHSMINAGEYIGRLTLANPKVTVGRDGISALGYPTLTSALNSITSAGSYTVSIVDSGFGDAIAPRTFNTNGVNITLAGIGGERQINLSSSGALFTVGSDSMNTTISLTLGANITLAGRSANNNPVVRVRNGASFTMLTGSKITGNTSTANGGGVYVESGIFNMGGGEISGNVSNTNGGGVYFDSGTFRIGGTAVIKNNARGTTLAGAVNNVFLTGGRNIILGGNSAVPAPASGMEVGVTALIGVIVGNANSGQAQYFFADDSRLSEVRWQSNALELAAKAGVRTVVIDMYDSNADGWDHNAALRILIGGVEFATTRVYNSPDENTSGNRYTNTYTFLVTPGDVVNINYTGSTGSYHSENSFIVYYQDLPPNPDFATTVTGPTSWSGSNALLFRVRGSLSSTNLNTSLGEFTAVALAP